MIDTTYLDQCISSLEFYYTKIKTIEKSNREYKVYRSAIIQEFEIILEQMGKILKKSLRLFFSSQRKTRNLPFKDIFRKAGEVELLTIEQVERWLIYRDSRNDTSHQYGENFANYTLSLVEQFIQDAQDLSKIINNIQDDS